MRENRELGAKPKRARHCKGELLLKSHSARGKAAANDEPESGDLPGKVSCLREQSRLMRLDVGKSTLLSAWIFLLIRRIAVKKEVKR